MSASAIAEPAPPAPICSARFPFGVEAVARERRDEAAAVGHVAGPAPVRLAPHHVADFEHARAFARYVAMAERERLVRHRDDDAVEGRKLLGEPEEVLHVRGLHLQRDHQRVMPARREALRDAGGRFHLRDRIADGDVDAGRAVE